MGSTKGVQPSWRFATMTMQMMPNTSCAQRVPVDVVSAADTTSTGTRWAQLVFGIICMVMVANLQLGWTPFVDPIDQKYHWGRYAIQWAFTIFVLTQTWLVPPHGYLVDRFGPRLMISAAGLLVGTAWVLNAYADSLLLLYLAAVIGGLGVGIVYGGA